MTGTSDQLKAAVVSTGLGAIAGAVGGPVLSAAVGLVSGVPLPFFGIAALVAMIWFDPFIGIWLAIAAVTAIGGFILGAVRRPPISLSRVTSSDDGTQRIAHLEKRLAEARIREHALIAALAAAHHPRLPAALPVPSVRGQVSPAS